MSKSKTTAIEIKNLVKEYPSRKGKSPANKALRNIDLNIPKGSVFGLLGPNGAGKSTLINILAGLTLKTSGEVIINGVDLDQNPRETRYHLGVVPQEVVLDPFFSVEEALEYHAGYYGVPKAKRKTQEIIKALSLSDKAKSNSRQLSGGMKRRVLIAKALVHSPPIVILDEPTAGVDVDLRSQLWDYVRKLNKNGTTILLTTHYLEEAESICDDIAIINHGRIIAQGGPKDLTKILDSKQITLVFNEKIKKIPAEFKKLEAKLTDDYALTIRYKKSTTGINEIFGAVTKNKLTIKDISTEEPDLEDIFRHLVKK